MQPPVWATALLLGLGLGLAVDAKIIQLPGGGVSVHGGTCTAGDVEVDSFFSIPYAEPPVDALRWAAPRPWSASKCSHSSGGGGSGGSTGDKRGYRGVIVTSARAAEAWGKAVEEIRDRERSDVERRGGLYHSVFSLR